MAIGLNLGGCLTWWGRWSRREGGSAGGCTTPHSTRSRDLPREEDHRGSEARERNIDSHYAELTQNTQSPSDSASTPTHGVTGRRFTGEERGEQGDREVGHSAGHCHHTRYGLGVVGSVLEEWLGCFVLRQVT